MSTPPAQRPTAAARLRAAIQSVDWQHHLSTLAARQTPPNPANARQTTPSNAPAQNEPTATCSPAVMPSPAAHCAPSPIDGPGQGRHAPRAKARQTLPNHANARHHNENCKTNPSANLTLSHPSPPPCVPNFQTNPPARPAVPPARTRPPRPLTPNQLRAARLLVAGHSTTTIAAALGIDRHTLATWKRLPLFQQELRHLLGAPVATIPAIPNY